MKKAFLLSFIAIFAFQLKASDEKRKDLPKKETKEVVKVFEINEKLHESFFDYNKDQVETNAKKLKKAIDNVSNEEIKKLLAFSQQKLDEIKASNDREKNNQIYHMVSMALIHVLNQYDLGDKYNAYSCPMVKKKWIQNTKEKEKVHNPYAKNMPHCGSKDTSFN